MSINLSVAKLKQFNAPDDLLHTFKGHFKNGCTIKELLEQGNATLDPGEPGGAEGGEIDAEDGAADGDGTDVGGDPNETDGAGATDAGPEAGPDTATDDAGAEDG